MVDREVPSVPPWGKWGCSHPVTLRTWIFSLLVRAAEYPPSSGLCPLCLEQTPVSLAWEIWLLCSFLSQSVKPPAWVTLPSPAPYLFALLQPQRSPCCSSDTPGRPLPQGLCACCPRCLAHALPWYPVACSLIHLCLYWTSLYQRGHHM